MFLENVMMGSVILVVGLIFWLSNCDFWFDFICIWILLCVMIVVFVLFKFLFLFVWLKC